MDKYSTFENIDYILKQKPGQRSIRLHIDPKGRLVLSCSPIINKAQIESFLSSNRKWIESHVQMMKQYSYEENELIPFWGNSYKLKLIEGRRKVTLKDNEIEVRVNIPEDKEKIRKALCCFYKEKLMDYVSQRTVFWCEKLKVDVPKLSITNSKSRWGVCYYRKREVKFSAMTACLSEDLIDMTVLHEITHLLYHDHGEKFWSCMRKNMPDVEDRKAKLKQTDRNSSIHSLF